MHQPTSTTTKPTTTNLAMKRNNAQRFQGGSTADYMQMILPGPEDHIGNLYLGSLAAVRRVDLLKEHGIKHVFHIMRPGWEWEMDLEKFDFYSTTFPLHDELDEDILTDLDGVVDSLRCALLSGQNVLVHCRMGVSRSASIVIAYVIKYFGLSFEAAREFVASKRSKIDPNPTFTQDLRLYQVICRIREESKELRIYQSLIKVAELKMTQALDKQKRVLRQQSRERHARMRRMSDQEMVVQKEILGALEKDFGIDLDLIY
ncbi:protein-tyrosine phosphatase-like protein [Pterulicium gracile]|uniref:protein-tyrosine-phosphatase n=1 Tax=Pterulicium gracile TaxID=1884261 RepID=A0A5C3QW07_9AGAR|nr:protein-tyrosine phosphatase-like protein [Pterula gracilis]